MANWGGRRPGAGRPANTELAEWERNDLVRALTSGRTLPGASGPWRLLADGSAGEWTTAELRAAYDDGWPRDRRDWPGDERPTWAHFRFDRGMSAEKARAAWLASEQAADEREDEAWRRLDREENDEEGA